ncbi:MAG TPA: M28 family peptidase [Flavisolibacter sp.]|nr:M28 family peptidase [Flavisolibacter sp.]
MKKLLNLVLVLSTINSFAQKPETFAKTITTEDLKRHLYIVASKEMEGRETATPGQRKAAAYIENHFKQLGLQPGNNGDYQMYFNVYQDSLTEATLEVNGKAFQLDKDFNPSAANIPATIRFSEVVLIGSNSLDSVKNANLAGKLVMIVGIVPSGSRAQGGGLLGALQSKGIAGILSVSSVYPRTSPFNRKGNQFINGFRRSLTPQQYSISENVARAIIGDEYDNVKNSKDIVKTYTANILLDVKKATLTAQSSNVLGVLPGTDLKDEYLFITAHYDHLGKRGDSVIYYGADDDGSGTVGVLEIAEAFTKAKAAGKGPRRSIVFMTVSGEEKGLWGSEYYASHPVFPLDKTTADLNIDMIGRSDKDRKGDTINYVYVVGDDKLSSDLKPISEAANKKYTKLELDYKFNDPNDRNRIYYRSDHYNFAKNGVPIIFYYDGMLGADYHRPTDTPDKINYPLLAKRAKLVFYTAWEMANRNEMLKRDIPLDTNVFNR